MFGLQDNGNNRPAEPPAGQDDDETVVQPQPPPADPAATDHGSLTPPPEPPAPPPAFNLPEPQELSHSPGEPPVGPAAAFDHPSAPSGAPPLPANDDEDADDLLDIKQQALQQLSPLISHLDQTSEEKFKTTMMLMQATDNAGLVKDAYQAAKAISDEKARAQALLDVVNEINYFTQKTSQK